MTLGDTVVSAWLQPSCLRCLQVDVSQFVERVVLSLGLKFQTHEKFSPTCGSVPASRTRRAVRARLVSVVRQRMFLSVACLRLRLIDRVAGRIRARVGLLLLRWGLTVMLLMNNARGARMLQMRRNRTLLLMVGVMLHRGDNH